MGQLTTLSDGWLLDVHRCTRYQPAFRNCAPGVLAGVVRGVHPAQHQLAPRACRVVPIEPEGEDRLRHEALVHHVLEGRDCSPDRDLGEPQALESKEA